MMGPFFPSKPHALRKKKMFGHHAPPICLSWKDSMFYNFCYNIVLALFRELLKNKACFDFYCTILW